MVQAPIILNFARKTVTRAGDPALEHALRETQAAQKRVKMTGPGTARAKPAK